MTRALKVGLMMPQITGMRGRGTRHWPEVQAMAQVAEDVGFDSIWLVDHFLYLLDGEKEARGAWECWSLLSALAACTRKAELGTLVLGMGFRNPALLAKMADTVDDISEGRLILGIGAGYHDHEYRAFGFPTDHKFARFKEGIEIVSTLLKKGAIDFDGKYCQARECELRPRGPRPEGPPIMVGTIGPKTMRLTAKHADMWNIYYDDTKNQPSRLAPFREMLDEACRDTGRDLGTLERTATMLVAGPDVDPWWSRLPSGRADAIVPFGGGPEALAEELLAYAREGIAHVQISLDPTTPETIEGLAGVFEHLERDTR